MFDTYSRAGTCCRPIDEHRDAVCRLSLGEQTVMTPPAHQSSENPRWNVQIQLPLSSIEQVLTLTILSSAHGAVIGTFALSIKALEPYAGIVVDRWFELVGASGGRKCSTPSSDDKVLSHLSSSKSISDGSNRCPSVHLRLCYMSDAALRQIRVKFYDTTRRQDDRGEYTVYKIAVCRKDGTEWVVELRYSELLQLRNNLVKQLPDTAALSFPGKRWFGNMDADFIASRKHQLEAYLNQVLSVPAAHFCTPLMQVLQSF
eukprot:GILK01003515.1.p1 GENE.GILK01003515.1~~GILK01003515.1.p1  ORF type:complete len:259 (-),score=24.90 GILK01003515.1:115-891(-)